MARHTLGAALLAAALPAALLLARAEDRLVEVETNLGPIVGVDDGISQAFLGIRFAEAPERFKKAAPKRPWMSTYNATKYGNSCIGAKVRPHIGVAEDCLFTNIWRPSQWEDPNRLLPVAIFIHGGGFMSGSGNEATYWGDQFVQHPLPTVLVTFNYRFGIFGFFSSPETGSNFGMTDQQELLRWVSKHIASFGGNPNDVTLVGQSAGAMSVFVHLVAPDSRGLFHRAFLASAVGLHYRNESENAAFISSAARAVGCFGLFRAQLACLRRMPARLLAKVSTMTGYFFHLQAPCASGDNFLPLNFLPWVPVVDGKILPRSPMDMIVDRLHAKVPVVLSTVRNESITLIPGMVGGIADWEVVYGIAINVMFREKGPEIERHYAESPDSMDMDLLSRVALIVTDTIFTCYNRYVAKHLMRDSPTYISTFLHAPSANADPYNSDINKLCRTGATCHCADLNFMFPQSQKMQAMTRVNYTREEIYLAFKYSTAIKGFIHGGTGEWVQYGASDKSTLWETSGPRVETGYHSHHCDFLESMGFQEPWSSSPTHDNASDSLPLDSAPKTTTTAEAGLRAEERDNVSSSLPQGNTSEATFI